jgi:hypothetical protein
MHEDRTVQDPRLGLCRKARGARGNVIEWRKGRRQEHAAGIVEDERGRE